MNDNQILDENWNKSDYFLHVQREGKMSKKYSKSDFIAYINPKFAEKLVAKTVAHSEDLSHLDMSFDCRLLKDVGVGVKTFVAHGRSSLYKCEKIAEFPTISHQFKDLGCRELAMAVSMARNQRISDDVGRYGINLEKSKYHCLIRIHGGAIIHEEPYQLVNIDNISPLNSRGKIGTWEDMKGKNCISFFDGINKYKYYKSKSVLQKYFVFDRENSIFIPITIDQDPFCLEENFDQQSFISFLNNQDKNKTVSDLLREFASSLTTN
jgi:hypothetical protein